MTLHTIGQVARQSGVGVETVRFYEREGLIPQPSRECPILEALGEPSRTPASEAPGTRRRGGGKQR